MTENQICWKINERGTRPAEPCCSVGVSDGLWNGICGVRPHCELCVWCEESNGVDFLEGAFANVVRFAGAGEDEEGP